MNILRSAFVVAALVAAGCSDSKAGGSDGGGDMASAVPGDMAKMIPTSCSITFSSSQGSDVFTACDVSTSLDNSIRIQGTTHTGSGLMKNAFIIWLPNTVAVKKYALADMLPNTTFEVIFSDKQVRYFAGKDPDGAATGSVSFEVLTLPQQPDGGTDTWIDHSMHALISATMPHDLTTPPLDSMDPMTFTASF